MITKYARGAAALAVAGWLVASAPAFADSITYVADLSAASVVPPTDSKATGMVTATYDAATKELVWKGTYAGLSGAETAAHFHIGAAGKNGGVAVPMAAAASPFEGKATLSDAQAADLAAGNWYVNIHTGAHPDGEIRGQVVVGK